MNSSSILAAPAPAPVELVARIPDPGQCVSIFKFDRGTYNGVFDQACVNLVENCRFAVADANSTDIWSFKTCVAAATCQGAGLLVDMVQCTPSLNVPGNTGANVPEGPQTNSLNYNTAPGNKVVVPSPNRTIDFVFGALSDIDTSSWPDVNNVINNWWTSIKDWTATGETVPYLNFNDWLRFSDS
ncbi:hypothetical protein D9758_013391 [Tetrapyrgos nigripes]|uniref:Uncharacterized protein n=1 Tax=Tetrapyrgos nigripes TaxID=182062 RepID=A0A8H5FNQ2_9AGAR|nr:hypothetical protein D9758_013391 [Tetrapyrgos nigripes]